MFRKSSILAVAGLVLVFSGQLMAGGPPWLCVPIVGVTKENAGECTKLLNTKLGSKVWSNSERYRGIQIRQNKDQSYLTFYIQGDVGLRDIEAALQGSKFSIPREKLHLFGHVVLEVETSQAPRKELMAALKALDHVSVVESVNHKDRVLVTVDMPYPVADRGSDRESLAWEKFQRNDFNSDSSAKSAPQITARMLPSYVAIRDFVAKHDAKLSDIRWSTNYACRAVGCVTAPDSTSVATAKNSPQE